MHCFFNFLSTPIIKEVTLQGFEVANFDHFSDAASYGPWITPRLQICWMDMFILLNPPCKTSPTCQPLVLIDKIDGTDTERLQRRLCKTALASPGPTFRRLRHFQSLQKQRIIAPTPATRQNLNLKSYC